MAPEAYSQSGGAAKLRRFLIEIKDLGDRRRSAR